MILNFFVVNILKAHTLHNSLSERRASALIWTVVYNGEFKKLLLNELYTYGQVSLRHSFFFT